MKTDGTGHMAENEEASSCSVLDSVQWTELRVQHISTASKHQQQRNMYAKLSHFVYVCVFILAWGRIQHDSALIFIYFTRHNEHPIVVYPCYIWLNEYCIVGNLFGRNFAAAASDAIDDECT